MTLREKLLENFRCQNCGNCCQRKGGIVYITRAEAAAIAQFLQKPLFVFLQENCKKQRGWLVLSDEKFCPECYLDQNQKCRIYPVRPKYCRQYPLVPEILRSDKAIVAEAKLCPGIALLLKEENHLE